MYSKISVRIPQVPGKITSIKKGKATYILYEYDRVYKPEKKYTIAQRAIIGKVTDADEQKMSPNENNQKYFPNAILPEELPEAYRSYCLKIGTYLVRKDLFGLF